MPKYRYRVLRLDFTDGLSAPVHEEPHRAIEAALNEAGAQGWELVKSDFLLAIDTEGTTSSNGPHSASNRGRTLAQIGSYVAVLKQANEV